MGSPATRFSREGGTGDRRRRCSGGLRRWESSGRCEVKDGRLENVVGDDYGFLRRCRRVAGDGSGFGCRRNARITARLGKKKVSAVSRERW
jgi:hypothetical protein